VDGQNVIIAGRGIKAFKFEKEGDKITARELWNNPDRSVQFNTPALKDGLLYGLTPNNELFCINARDGKVAWSAPLPTPTPAAGAAMLDIPIFVPSVAGLPQAEPAPQTPPGRPRGPGGPGGPDGPGGQGGQGGRRGGMGGGSGYGSIVDAGSVLMALTPSGQLIIFEPSDKEFKQIAAYKVAAGQTHAYPIASGNRIFIKDRDSLTLWTVD
jgi:outer membrane protein assembly factor BamB